MWRASTVSHTASLTVWAALAAGCPQTATQSADDVADPPDASVDVVAPDASHDVATDLPSRDVPAVDTARTCGGLTPCSGVCRDLVADPHNCGACGRVCATGQECAGGACRMAPCGDGFAVCGGECVNVTSDPRHCGSCETPCCPGSVCADGTCVVGCSTGLTDCADPGSPDVGCRGGGVCRDLSTDSRNCSACGHACGPNELCSMGRCIFVCGRGLITCGMTCVDPEADSSNCGACGFACPRGLRCGGGHCEATLDAALSDAASVDATADHADVATCPLPAESAACTADGDCAMVARGCYCAQQPVVGVNTRFSAVAGACEVDAARHCALGCAVFPGRRAQDSRSDLDGGTIAVRCERDAGSGLCMTFVR